MNHADKQLAHWILGSFACIGIVGVALACTTVAKTQYGAQLDGCIEKAHSRAEADQCLAAVRLAWDDAGAKPALVFVEGGSHD